MKFSSHLLLLLLGICFASNQAMAKLLSGNENITAVEGTTVQLPCEVDEPDETAIQWSKESENGTIRLFSSTLRQTTDLRYQMNPQTYTLSIENVHKNDSGIFTCDDGETTAVHQLSVTASEAPESAVLTVFLVVLALLVCAAIVGTVIFVRKRRTQYQPANPIQVAFKNNS